MCRSWLSLKSSCKPFYGALGLLNKVLGVLWQGTSLHSSQGEFVASATEHDPVGLSRGRETGLLQFVCTDKNIREKSCEYLRAMHPTASVFPSSFCNRVCASFWLRACVLRDAPITDEHRKHHLRQKDEFFPSSAE